MKTTSTESVRAHRARPHVEMPDRKFSCPEDLAHIEEPLEMAAEISMKDIKAIPKAAVFPGILLGTWVNINPTTRGLVKVELKLVGPKFTVRPYGACHPTPCDWGSRVGIAYASNVSSKQPRAFTASFPQGFKDTILTGHLDRNLLVVETYNHFKDGSGRSDYYSRELFRRA